MNTDWTNDGTCYYKLSNIRGKEICSFDLDDTLVSFKSKDILPNVKEILCKLYENYDIIIFSNQKGIKTNKITHDFIHKIITDIEEKFNINISIFYSISDDIYRKPMIGMYNLCKQIYDNNNKPCKFIYYCGDACGRPKDFSISDLYFANNCEIPFKTPEDIFGGIMDKNISTKYNSFTTLYKNDIYKEGKLISNFKVDFEGLDEILNYNFLNSIIILIGPPGSGKSTISKLLKDKYNYPVINNDSLKAHINKEKYDGIIVDNTNYSLKNRELIKNKCNKLKVIYIHINIEKNLSIHLSKYREMFTSKHIPTVAIHTYYKRLEIPSDTEYDELITINKPILNGNTFNYSYRFN
tara:strand:- start:5925 stop:6983 length:1059 start_codon:yes stop_codon:yes gene_type:complete